MAMAAAMASIGNRSKQAIVAIYNWWRDIVKVVMWRHYEVLMWYDNDWG